MVYMEARADVRINTQNTAAVQDGGERILAGQKRNNQSGYIGRSMSKCIFNWIWWCLRSCGVVFGAQLKKLPSSIALDLRELENWFLQSCQTQLKGSRSMETSNMSLTKALVDDWWPIHRRQWENGLNADYSTNLGLKYSEKENTFGINWSVSAMHTVWKDT